MIWRRRSTSIATTAHHAFRETESKLSVCGAFDAGRATEGTDTPVGRLCSNCLAVMESEKRREARGGLHK